MELISIFLENLYPEADDASAEQAIQICNEYFKSNRDDYTDEDLLALYDSACEYKIPYWPQPLGWAVRGALRGNKYFELMDKKGLTK